MEVNKELEEEIKVLKKQLYSQSVVLCEKDRIIFNCQTISDQDYKKYKET